MHERQQRFVWLALTDTRESHMTRHNTYIVTSLKRLAHILLKQQKLHSRNNATLTKEKPTNAVSALLYSTTSPLPLLLRSNDLERAADLFFPSSSTGTSSRALLCDLAPSTSALLATRVAG